MGGSGCTKNMLWDDILKHFTLPPGMNANLVKQWTLTKMATQLQSFKKQLHKNYIKKNRTPNFDDYPKLKVHCIGFPGVSVCKESICSVGNGGSIPGSD